MTVLAPESPHLFFTPCYTCAPHSGSVRYLNSIVWPRRGCICPSRFFIAAAVATSCSSDNLVMDGNADGGEGRTVTLTAKVGDNGVTTRVGMTKGEDSYADFYRRSDDAVLVQTVDGYTHGHSRHNRCLVWTFQQNRQRLFPFRVFPLFRVFPQTIPGSKNPCFRLHPALRMMKRGKIKKAFTVLVEAFWRKVRDSNPRYPKGVYRISSPAHSVTLPTFL